MTERVIKINQIKLKPDAKNEELQNVVVKAMSQVLGLEPKKYTYKISKKSIDSRHKPDIFYVYSVDVFIEGTDAFFDKIAGKLAKSKSPMAKKMTVGTNYIYEFPVGQISVEDNKRPVVIGFGPAGMFAALKLARAGLRPVVYERGQAVDDRIKTVDGFWRGEKLNVESNVQFGEGGAGTFSDGKLNTMIKDPSGRIKEVLKVFVSFGADSSIEYVNKPHIGTDVLAKVVKNIRQEIIRLGGEVIFNTKLVDIKVDNDNRICGVWLIKNGTSESFFRECENVVLSVGHSARDTFEMLKDKPVVMQPKAFAVGVRMEHPQEFINYNAYGGSDFKLPVADYKVTYQTTKGRGVYSFCMCPGGYVVNASSEQGHLAVNGMSYSGRNGANANSAIIVTVTPDDFGNNVLDGMEFQRKLEKAAFNACGGKVPVQLFGDFKHKRVSTGFGKVIPSIKGEYAFADLNSVLPLDLCDCISEGITGFSGSIRGFDMEDAVLSGVESRTSSPLRILRNEYLESSIAGLFPCGEGAGYAGGITSAAVDGIKVAERIALKIDDNHGKI